MAFGPFADQDFIDPYSRNLLIQKLRQPAPGLPQTTPGGIAGGLATGGITGPATGGQPVQGMPPTQIGTTPYAGPMTTQTEPRGASGAPPIFGALSSGQVGPHYAQLQADLAKYSTSDPNAPPPMMGYNPGGGTASAIPGRESEFGVMGQQTQAEFDAGYGGRAAGYNKYLAENQYDPKYNAPGATPDPTGILPRMSDPAPFDLTGYARRGGGTGGVGSGAASGAGAGALVGNYIPIPGVGAGIGAGVGALVGGIKGAFGKHAASAPTDLSVADARAAIADAYQQQLGRPATEQEITQHLQNTGWQQGDPWVGEAGLQHILGTSVGGSPEAAAFAAKGAAPSVPGAPAPPAAAAAGVPPPAGTPPPAAKPPATTGTTGKVQTKAPLGFDQTKWNDPNHTTIKYVAGRILSKYGPLGKHNMPQAWAEIKAAFPNATWDGDDGIDFGDGFGPIDVVKNFATGKGHPQWHVVNQQGKGKGKGTGGPADQGREGMSGGSLSGVNSPLLGGDPIAAIQALLADKTRAEMLRQLQGLIPGGSRGDR